MGLHDGEPFGSTFYRTPNMSRLAAEGMTFTQSYAAAAVCSPSRAALLTGIAPARLHITDWIPGEGQYEALRFRVPDWQLSLPLETTTLAEALHDCGYLTASIGKWHLGGEGSLPQDHGFDINIAGSHIGHPASFHWPYGNEGTSHRVPDLAEAGGERGEYLTDRLTSEALAVIDSARARDLPFFVYLPFYAVHSPLQATETDLAAASDAIPSNGQGNQTYHAMIAAVDRSVGRLMDHLASAGIADDTIVVFTSDNGGAVHFGTPPATSNAPQRNGKGTAYEGGLRVPLIIKAPGVTSPGSTCDVPVVSHDHFPTLLALAGCRDRAASAAEAPDMDGADLTRLLRGDRTQVHDAIVWHYPHYWNGGRVTPYSVIRAGDFKLIRFHEEDREELYDLAADPSETTDLAALQPARRTELSEALDAWLAEAGAQIPIARSPREFR